MQGIVPYYADFLLPAQNRSKNQGVGCEKKIKFVSNLHIILLNVGGKAGNSALMTHMLFDMLAQRMSNE